MAQDWLATLMSGVGGAFTGYGVARDRRMTEAERARQAQRQQQQDALGAFSTQLEQRAALDQLGYRPSAEMNVPRGTQGGMVPGSSVAAMVPTDAIVGAARRGPGLTTPQGESFTLDRLATPDARRVRDVQMKQAEARAELDRRMQERDEDRKFQAAEKEKDRENQRNLLTTRITASGDDPTDSGNPLLSLPPVERRTVIANRSKLGVVDMAAEALKAYPDAVGLGRGMTPGMLRDRSNVMGINNPLGDPKGVPARALLGNLSSLEIRDRSGAAVTAAEFPRLKPFIPILSGPSADDYDTILWKLEQFKRVVEEENLAIGDAFGVDLGGYTANTGTAQRNRTAGQAPRGQPQRPAGPLPSALPGATSLSQKFTLPYPD